MDDRSTIQKSLELLAKNEVKIGENLQSVIDEEKSPVYKIAVVGRYQTGKTTLVNKVFLKDDFLATGCGLCKTSVVTRLSCGDAKKVVLVKRLEGDATSVEELPEPDAAKIEAVTCAENNDARLSLAKSIAEVQIEWPCPTLKNYVIYDTPGIDDPVEELLDETTYRVLPKVDMVILVVEPKQLSQQELVFLSHKIFKNGLKRVMLLVSYNPAQSQSDSARDGVLSAIRGQLAGIGREYFPVHMCTYDCSVSGNILNTVEKIEKEIVEFADQNAAIARDEKIRYALSFELMKLRNDMVAQTTINGKSDTEIAEIKGQVAKVGDDMDCKYKSILAKFKGEYFTFKDKVHNLAVESLDHAKDKVMGEVEKLEDFSALQSAIPKISNRAKSEFETALVEINTFATGRLKDILAQQQSDLEAAAKELVLPATMSVSINTGWVGKLNPKVLIASEYALMWWLMGGPLGAGLRYATAFVPGLKKILPSSFAKNAVVSSVRESLERNYEDILYLVDDSLEETRGYVCKAIADKFVELHTLTCAPYDKAIANAASKKLSPEELSNITKEVETIDSLVNELK